MALSDNLVSFWKLDETSGTRYDAYGTNDLTDNNTVGYAAGKILNAASFTSASSEYLSVADNAGLSPSTNFSISLWFYPTSSSQQALASKGTYSSSWSWALYKGSSGQLIFYYSTGAGDVGSNYAFTANSLISTNTWYHVVVTYDGGGSGNSGKLKLYLDTVSKTLTYQTNVPTSFYDSTGPFTLGDLSGASGYYGGYLDSVGVWNATLGTSDISTLYNSGNDYDYPFVALGQYNTAYWNLDETSGSRADSYRVSTLTDNNTVSYGTGVISNAASFSSDYLSRIANTPTKWPGYKFTVAGWFNLGGSVSNGETIFSKWDGAGGPILHTPGSGTATELKLFHTGSGSDYGITSGLGLSANTWYHFALVYNGAGSTNDDKFKLYINGSLQSLTWTGASVSATINDNATLEIGNWTTLNYYLFGLVDEVGFWQTNLGSTEISSLYNSGSGLTWPFATTPPPAGDFWQFTWKYWQ